MVYAFLVLVIIAQLAVGSTGSEVRALPKWEEVVRPNLIIGGIWQTAEDQANNQRYADALNAEYVRTYYTGWEYNTQDPLAVVAATPILFSPDYKTVIENNQLTAKVEPVEEKPATSGGMVYRNVIDPSTGDIVNYARYKATDLNGLTNKRLNPSENGDPVHYDTIYAHSGGARTAVTALLYQDVTADKLVLIDPGNVDESEIQQLLDKGIDVDYYFYYPEELWHEPTLGFHWRGMIRDIDFKHGDSLEKGNLNVIPLESKDLGLKKGNDAHIQIWETALNRELGYELVSTTDTKPAIPVRSLSTLGGLALSATGVQSAANTPDTKPAISVRSLSTLGGLALSATAPSTGVQSAANPMTTQLSGSKVSDWLQPRADPWSQSTSGLDKWGGYPKGMGPRKSEGYPAPRWGVPYRSGPQSTSGSTGGTSSAPAGSAGSDPTATLEKIDQMFRSNDPVLGAALQAGMG